MNSSVAAACFALGLVLFAAALFPAPMKNLFMPPSRKQSLADRMRLTLKTAGVFDEAPLFVLVVLLVSSLTCGLVLGILAGSIWGGLLGFMAVPFVAYLWVTTRQRRFMVRASDELVPFLNRIATSSVAGRPVSTAYVEAVQEGDLLRELLADSAAEITSGVRFEDALLRTLPVFPLRMWSVFVRQIEAYSEGGGDLGSSLQRTIEQINALLNLQAEARADYAAQSKQIWLIVGIVIGFLAFFTFFVNADIFSLLWTTPAGFLIMGVGIGVMAGGVWFARKQLKDIQKKLNF